METELVLTTYDKNPEMGMDVRIYQMKAGETLCFGREGEETAVLLLQGILQLRWGQERAQAAREDVFTEGPWCLHAGCRQRIEVEALKDAEILVQCAGNEKAFAARLYEPKDAPWTWVGRGEFGNMACRRVNTIFDYEKNPLSRMVLGEVLSERGSWSAYPPHRHPQPELYFFRFDRPEGFGASFVGERVSRSENNSFTIIPGGELHPQAAAPGYQMYTCWMIRHLEGNPWMQTDRCEDERYGWLHTMK